MNFLGLTQAPHASWLNGSDTAVAREYWLRQSQGPVNGPRIEAAIAGMAPGEFRAVWVNSDHNIFRVRSAEDGDGFDILDWNPRGAWDPATRQIYIGGFRERRKLIAYSDITGRWRECQVPLPMARTAGTGHWYGMTVADDSGGVYIGATGERQLYRLNPADDSAAITPTQHEVTNGSNGAMLSFSPALFAAGGVVKYAGNARRWLRYDPTAQVWDRPAQSLPNAEHALVERHPLHDRWLLVGGTLTSRVATIATAAGAFTQVTDAPDNVQMSKGSWIHAHPAGCWLVRTVNDPSLASRLYAAWPNAGFTDVTWVDLGEAPDSALTHPTLIPGYASDLVLIVATTGIYAYKLPVLSPPETAGTVAVNDAGDLATVVGAAPSAGTVAVEDAGDTAQISGSTPAVAAVAVVDSPDFVGVTVDESPGTLEPGEVWAFVLPNGLTAGDTLVAIHAYLQDLHRIHGLELGMPLVVTPTSRTAGPIEQIIAAVGETVSVVRQ